MLAAREKVGVDGGRGLSPRSRYFFLGCAGLTVEGPPPVFFDRAAGTLCAQTGRAGQSQTGVVVQVPSAVGRHGGAPRRVHGAASAGAAPAGVSRVCALYALYISQLISC